MSDSQPVPSAPAIAAAKAIKETGAFIPYLGSDASIERWARLIDVAFAEGTLVTVTCDGLCSQSNVPHVHFHRREAKE